MRLVNTPALLVLVLPATTSAFMVGIPLGISAHSPHLTGNRSGGSTASTSLAARGGYEYPNGECYTNRAFRRPSTSTSTTASTVDEEFEKLMNDLNDSISSQDVNKQKQWVKRAFDLASEVTRDMAASEGQAQRNEQLLEKQQKWVEKFIDFASDLGQDLHQGTDPSEASKTAAAAANAGTAPSTSAEQERNRNPWSRADKNDDDDNMMTVTPTYTIDDDARTFQVALELPGVLLSDINIDADTELHTLTISGERRMIGTGGMIKFSKTFALDPLVMVDKITANLSHGILLVNAPKKETTKPKGRSIKVPISSDE